MNSKEKKILGGIRSRLSAVSGRVAGLSELLYDHLDYNSSIDFKAIKDDIDKSVAELLEVNPGLPEGDYKC